MLKPITDRESAQALFATLKQHAHSLGVVLRPSPPEPTQCCGRGCNGCVWEGFFAAAAYWQEDALAALETTRTQHHGALAKPHLCPKLPKAAD